MHNRIQCVKAYKEHRYIWWNDEAIRQIQNRVESQMVDRKQYKY